MIFDSAAVVVSFRSALINKNDIVLNHPFYFFIVNNENILFMGVLRNPI